MIQLDMSYRIDGEHKEDYILFAPNYYVLGKARDGIVLFMHSPIQASEFIATMQRCHEVFGLPLPAQRGFYALVEACTHGIPIKVVTVEIGRPIPEAMWEYSDNRDHEHAQYLQECLASIFPR